jgi:hypothetical protein
MNDIIEIDDVIPKDYQNHLLKLMTSLDKLYLLIE